MFEMLMNAFEPQVFFANLIGEVTNDVSATAAVFAIKSFGTALLGMASNFNRSSELGKRITLRSRKRNPKSSVKRSARHRS